MTLPIDRLEAELAARFCGLSPDPSEEQLHRARGELLAELARQVAPYQSVVLALIARLRPLLGTWERAMQAGRPRMIYRIDAGHITKDPAGILQKMARKWHANLERDERAVPPITPSSIHTELTDLGRFRIACNFMSDVRALARMIEASCSGAAEPGSAEAALAAEFELRDGRFENAMDILPSTRNSGERCFKAVFILRGGPMRGRTVELQLMTVLQEAWDKKDHVLVYEPMRRKEPVPDDRVRASFALSELLFVADQQFDAMLLDVVGGD